MELIESVKSLEPISYADRLIYKAVGKDGVIKSGKMTVGYGYYSYDIGAMEPHHHAEETIFIVEAKNSFVRYGESKDQLGESIPLKNGMMLHFDELEWHVFDCEKDGHLTIVFIYGQVDNIRPEDIQK